MRLDKLTPAEVDALEGAEREAWYAWRNGRADRLREIVGAYGLRIELDEPASEPEPVEVETPEDRAAPTVEAAVKRGPGRPRKYPRP